MQIKLLMHILCLQNFLKIKGSFPISLMNKVNKALQVFYPNLIYGQDLLTLYIALFKKIHIWEFI